VKIGQSNTFFCVHVAEQEHASEASMKTQLEERCSKQWNCCWKKCQVCAQSTVQI